MSTSPRPPLLAVRVAPSIKCAFDALALRLGLSTSALLLRLVQTVLQSNGPGANVASNTTGRSERFSVRLRPGDREALEALAAARCLRPASYVTALVHSHLHSCPALPVNELAALKVVASHLATTARRLQECRATELANACRGDHLLTTLSATADDVAELRSCVGQLVRANLRCWESGHV